MATPASAGAAHTEPATSGVALVSSDRPALGDPEPARLAAMDGARVADRLLRLSR